MLHTREKFINALYNNVHFQVIGKYFAMVIRLDYYLLYTLYGMLVISFRVPYIKFAYRVTFMMK